MAIGKYDDDEWGAKPVEVRRERPYEMAFTAALKETAELRDAVKRLREAIEPALTPEFTDKTIGESVPEPPKSAVVRDFDNLRFEIRAVADLVQSINNRVHL